MERHTDAAVALVVVGVVAALLAVPSIATGTGALQSATVVPPSGTTRAVAATSDVGTRYLALASPLNARVAELSGQLDTPRTIAELQSIAGSYAAVEEEFAVGLGNLAAPASLSHLVVDAEMAARHVAALNRRLADPDTAPQDVVGIGSDLGHALDDQRHTIERLREALGLGPPPAE